MRKHCEYCGRAYPATITIGGGIWWPYGAKASLTRELSDYGLECMAAENGEFTVESINRWVDCNSGDFSSVDWWEAIINAAYYSSDL